MRHLLCRRTNTPRTSAGFTIVETLVAVAISSILFMFALIVYNAYARMTHAQESQAELQQQFMLVRRLIEKDIHMSGLNLPGNGLFPMNYGSGDFKLVFLRDENKNTTILENNAVVGDSLLCVKSVNNASSKQWVCLERSGALAYYLIARIGVHSGLACDTVKLQDSVVSINWDKSATTVYFAKGVYYTITNVNAVRSMMRCASDGDQAIGPFIDSIGYEPKDASGILTGNVFPQAQSLQITLGGGLNFSVAKSRMFKTFDALIRN
jgi:prepilin-type N-terminal cleavage/methylation domain-containing protein